MKKLSPTKIETNVAVTIDGMCVSLSYYKEFGYFRCNDKVYRIGKAFQCPGWIFDKIKRAPRFTKKTFDTLGLKFEIINEKKKLVKVKEI